MLAVTSLFNITCLNLTQNKIISILVRVPLIGITCNFNSFLSLLYSILLNSLKPNCFYIKSLITNLNLSQKIFFSVNITPLKWILFPISDVHAYTDSEEYNENYPDDDYSADEDYLNENEKVVHTIPEFISEEVDLIVNEGETIKLPCLVDKLGEW